MFLGGAALAAALLILPSSAHASRVRYHYVPSDGGCMVLAPTADGAPGERLSWIGRGATPFRCAPKPTQNMCFTHPCTGQSVVVPLALPVGVTPRIEHRARGVSFDYGSDTVNVNFLSDGTVDVVYDSGLFREAYTANGP